jgi:hypothetical protein
VLHRRSIIFLLTDFLHSFGPVAGQAMAGRDTLQELGLTNARHDLVCVHLHDPRESRLPHAGLLTIEDAETGELLEMDTHRAAVRDAYARSNAERLAELDRALRRAGVETLSFSTVEPFAPTKQNFFETGAEEAGLKRSFLKTWRSRHGTHTTAQPQRVEVPRARRQHRGCGLAAGRLRRNALSHPGGG